MQILTVKNKKEEKFLRKKTRNFDFSKFSRKEIKELISAMRQAMKKAEGIGLSANQIGIDASVFVAEVNNKFYAFFNPKIEKSSAETMETEEGCLSVPDSFGLVKRAEKITISGFDQSGKKVKIKAWGLLARVFQHEIDHLNGILFIDKAKNLEQMTDNK